MTLDEAIEFIFAKVDLLAKHVTRPEEREGVLQIKKLMDGLLGHPRLSLQQLRSLDGEMLERWLEYSTSSADEAEIRRQLVARFKTSRIRASDKTVVRRVLKRGAIADLELELEKQFGFRRLGPSPQARLARLLATNDALDMTNRLVIERFISNFPHQTLFTKQEIARARGLLKQPSPSNPPKPMTMTPRPKQPPDMSLLVVGAVFELQRDKRPHRVIAFDDIEVFYEVDFGSDAGWSAGLSRQRISYYRDITPLFLSGAKRLHVDQPTDDYLALHRPDLPLRFARSSRVQWSNSPCATREEFIAFLEQTAPTLLSLPPLKAREIVLIPRSPKGALQRAVRVKAENGASLPVPELLWAAHRLQRPIKNEAGVGIYRAGLEKRGVPSYWLSGFMNLALRWHAEAPCAE